MKLLKLVALFGLGLASVVISRTASAEPADKELMAAYERGMACYRNLACKPTISKTTIDLLETMKCVLDSKCKDKADPALQAQLSRLKEEFPPLENANNYYQRAFAPDRDPAYAPPPSKSRDDKSASDKSVSEKKAPVYEEISIDQKTTMDSQYGK